MASKSDRAAPSGYGYAMPSSYAHAYTASVGAMNWKSNWRPAKSPGLHKPCSARRFEPRKPRKHHWYPQRILASVKIGCKDWTPQANSIRLRPRAKLIAPGLPNSPVLALIGIKIPLPTQIELSPSRIYAQTLTTPALCSPIISPRSESATRSAHATQPSKVHSRLAQRIGNPRSRPMPVIAQNLPRAPF